MGSSLQTPAGEAGPQRRRVAVVLFNLGGPDRLESVRPFLFNLFNDPAIITLPAPFRTAIAWFISSRREKEAQHNYAHMGGSSPLLRETEAQARALEAALTGEGEEVRIFIAMRYWHPLTDETTRAVAAFAPDEVVLLPLYPQFSTTTSASSLKAWGKAYRGPGRVRTVCCWPELDGLVAAHARLIEQVWDDAGRPEGVRVLFSAHGLPEQVIERGDPYQWQVERTCAAVAAALARRLPAGGWDWKVCYQSRVGPLKWLGPATPDAIIDAIAEDRDVLLVPIAFVSEHVETLVELDRDYAELAAEKGCNLYLRAPAVGIGPEFIAGLAAGVRRALGRGPGVEVDGGGRLCPKRWTGCPSTCPAPLEEAA